MGRLSIAFMALVIVSLVSETSGAPFLRRRRPQYVAPAPKALQPKVIPSQAIPQEPRFDSIVVKKTLDQKVLELLKRYQFVPGTIPQGSISLDDARVYSAALLWSQAQNELEKLFQRELKLEYRPKLFLVVKETPLINGGFVLSFVMSDPHEQEIKDVLCRVIPASSSLFDGRVNPIGETANILIDEFQPGLIFNDSLHMAKAQNVIRALLQDDKDLSTIAKNVNGAFKPIIVKFDLSPIHMNVLTEWQEINGDENMRIYWRANISLEKHSMEHYQLETLIDFGQRYKSQTFGQIQRVKDSNQISSLDMIQGDSLPGGEKVYKTRFRTLRSQSDTLLVDSGKMDIFKEMSPLLWNKVRASLLRKPKE